MQNPTPQRPVRRAPVSILGLVAKISVLLCIASVAVAVGLERPRFHASATSTATMQAVRAAPSAVATETARSEALPAAPAF